MRAGNWMVVFAALMAVPSFAGVQEPTSWDRFVKQCQDPKGSIDKQFLPENIVIKCTRVENSFVAADTGQFDLPASAHVSATLTSDKMALDRPDERDLAVKPGVGACVTYQEISRIVTTSSSLSCDDVIAIAAGKGEKPAKPGTPADYCEALGKKPGNKGTPVVEVIKSKHIIGECPEGTRHPGDEPSDKKDDKPNS